MQKLISLSLVCAMMVGAGCASAPGPFNSAPTSFASESELANRASAKAITCNSDPADVVFRSPGIFPFESADRSGRVRFIFDLDDAGKPINLQITEATEEAFIPSTLKAVSEWAYAPKKSGELSAKRENICSSLNFVLRDDLGRRIPTWTDIVQENSAYQKYKEYVSGK